MKISDKQLVEVFLQPIRKCAKYRPVFGQGKSDGLTAAEFQSLYEQDPFYAWIGLDDPLLYAAHKAAGGLTSLYRQIGVGSERLLRAVLMNTLALNSDQIDWSYEYPKPDGNNGIHFLDAKISLADLTTPAKQRFGTWLKSASGEVLSSNSRRRKQTGAAFEIRQGYKSADSKRQNADLRFGIRAYQAGLLPVFAILSSQVSDPVLRRYRHDGILVLTGLPDGTATQSTFVFFRDVIGYDLAGFFTRNSKEPKSEVQAVIKALLTPE